MPTGPLGEAALEPGPSLADGVRAGQYRSFRVSWPLEGACELVLARPEALSPMSVDFIRELHQILDVLQYPQSASPDGEPPVRVLIIRGEGKGFCAGLDLRDAQLGKANQPMLQHAFSGIMRKLRDIPQAVICGVNGVAAGGGLSLALAADVRLGARGCRFIPSFVRLGLGGGELGTSYFLPRIVGRGRAASLLLTGAELGDEQAERWGLITELHETQEELASACRAAASRMLALSPKGLRLTKWLLNNSQETSMAATLEREDLAQCYMSADPESQAVGARHTSRFRRSRL